MQVPWINAPITGVATTPNAADETAVRDVFDQMDHLDVLCANAGVAGPTALVEDVALARLAGLVSVSIWKGLFWLPNTRRP